MATKYRKGPRSKLLFVALVSFLTLLAGSARQPLAVATEVASPARSYSAPSFQPLLDADVKKKWRGFKSEQWPQGWDVKEKVLLRTTGGDDVMTVEQFSDFEFRLEWKISPGGNSGIMYRVSTDSRAPYWSGPEFQIVDDQKYKDGTRETTSAGSLYGLYARSENAAKPTGEWNKSRIVARGNHIEHWLNGKKVVDCEIGSDDWDRRLRASKFAKWPKFAKNGRGHIVLQDHGNPVWYREISIRRLPSSSKASSSKAVPSKDSGKN